MKNFVLIGAAGYIAPRHMKAIKETGNKLIAALDIHDSVGILDHYFPDCDFFTEFERFDRHCEKLKRKGISIDYVVVCSPNYLHDAHIRFGLRIGANVICEKPVVLNPWNLEALIDFEKKEGKQVYTILQLRQHPLIQELKKQVAEASYKKTYEIDLKYITARGRWYHHTWKGDVNKSGGIFTNIGLHFFDILLWIFGCVKENTVFSQSKDKGEGLLILEKAKVNWSLGIDEKMLPEEVREEGKRAYRLLSIDGKALNFSDGFTNLHTAAYEKTLSGNGVSLNETRQVIELVYDIRNKAL